MFLVPNRDVIIPFGADLRIRRQVNSLNDRRGENIAVLTLTDSTSVALPFTPSNPEWVEVFRDGFRVLNPRVGSNQGGTLYETYNVSGNVVTFSQPISGTIAFICDTTPRIQWNATILKVDNVQGSQAARASLYVEPVIITQPANGYARLTTDRMSMAYLPKTGFIGDDSFSYCLINNHGQYSKNYCVNITVY